MPLAIRQRRTRAGQPLSLHADEGDALTNGSPTCACCALMSRRSNEQASARVKSSSSHSPSCAQSRRRSTSSVYVRPRGVSGHVLMSRATVTVDSQTGIRRRSSLLAGRCTRTRPNRSFVSIMILGRGLPLESIVRVASGPSRTGIRMSMSTTSGSRRRTTEIAYSPSADSPSTCKPLSASRIMRNPAPHQSLVVGDDFVRNLPLPPSLPGPAWINKPQEAVPTQ